MLKSHNNSLDFEALKNEILDIEIEQEKQTKFSNFNQWAQVAINPVVIISNSKLRPNSQLQFGSNPADIELSGEDSFRLQFRAERPRTQLKQQQSRPIGKNCLPLNCLPSKEQILNCNLSTTGFPGKKIKQSLVQLGLNFNKVNQPLEQQWFQPVNKTASQIITNQQITVTDVREALKTKKLNSSNTTNRAESDMHKLYKKRPKRTNHYQGFIKPKANNTEAKAGQFTEYLKYEVIQSLVNRRLPFNLKDQKFESPEKTNSQLEIMGLYKELLCLQSREKKCVQQVFQDATINQQERKRKDSIGQEAAHVIPIASRARTDSVLTQQSIKHSDDSPTLMPLIVVEDCDAYDFIAKTEFHLQPKVLTSSVAPESEFRIKRQAASVLQEKSDLKQEAPNFKQQHALERISQMICRKQIQKDRGNPRENVFMNKRDQPNHAGDYLLKTSQRLYNQRLLLLSRDIKYSKKPFRVMKFDPKADYNKHGLTLFGNSDPICDFKKKLLMEQIQLSFSDDFNGQLKSFKVFCKFNPMMGLTDGTCTQCFTILTIGADSLISNCCSQLICFQFIQSLSKLEAQCLGSKCRHNPLTQVSLDREFISLCFETPNRAAQSKQKSRKSSQISIPDDYQSTMIFDSEANFNRTEQIEFNKQKRSIVCKVPKVDQNLERVISKEISGFLPEQKLQVQGHGSQYQKHRTNHSGLINNPLNQDVLKSHFHSPLQKKESDGEYEEHDPNVQSKRLKSQYARDSQSSSNKKAVIKGHKSIHKHVEYKPPILYTQ